MPSRSISQSMKAIHGDEENADLEHFLSDLILDQVTPSAMTRTAYAYICMPHYHIWYIYMYMDEMGY